MSDDSSLHEAGHAAGGREGNVAADCVIDPAMQITRSVSVEVPDRTLNQAIRRYQTAQSRGRDVDFESYLLDYVAVEPEWRTEGGDPVDPEEGLLTRDDSADDCTPTGGVADGGTVECPVCGESVTSTVVLGPDEISVQPCGHRVPARFADKTSDVEDGGQ